MEAKSHPGQCGHLAQYKAHLPSGDAKGFGKGIETEGARAASSSGIKETDNGIHLSASRFSRRWVNASSRSTNATR